MSGKTNDFGTLAGDDEVRRALSYGFNRRDFLKGAAWTSLAAVASGCQMD